MFANSQSSGVREAFRPRSVVPGFSRDLLRTRQELLAENAALRHQQTVLVRKEKRPKLRTFAGFILVAVAAITPTWREALLIVKPETV